MAGATHNIVAGSPTLSFYFLFSLLAVDTIMSCSTFFQEHGNRMTSSAGRSMGLLQKDENNGPHGGPNGDDQDYNRQL